ncbi:MAG: hypothetical protein ACOCXP_01190 [Candidatus Dojkabacteria bacterium]
MILGDILPSWLRTSFGSGTTSDLVISLIRNGLTILFGAVVLLAVIYSAIAGIKFITSGGEETKVTEAKEAIKNVMIGLLAAFLSIIVIFIIQGIFADGADNAVQDALVCFLDGTC